VKPFSLVLVFGLLTLLLAACGQAAPATAPTAAPAANTTAPTAAPAANATASDDLLAEVKQRGTLRISTDANYKPQSFKNADGSWEGFDIEVGREIAKRLGVQAEFLDISFDVITAGTWNGRWDINVGSMTITAERKQALLFTTPYYYTPAAFVVHNDSTATTVEELAGKNVGVGTATTYQRYLEGNLQLEGETIAVPAPQATVRVYDTDLLAIDDLKLGNGTRLDAVLTALPTAENAIKEGAPLKILGKPVYYEALAVALDLKSPLDSASLQAEISTAIEAMRADGTLTRLSMQYYGVDLTSKQ
jgi:polar amino acid transport system substrate-binding protein